MLFSWTSLWQAVGARSARRRPSRRGLRQEKSVEGLERRAMLTGDVQGVVGDCNLDGVFDSSDLVQAFQAGKFESGQAASWSEGDWDGDGAFGTADLVLAYQAGNSGDVSSSANVASAADGSTDDPTTGGDTSGGDTTGGDTTGGDTTGGGTTGDDTNTGDDTSTDMCDDGGHGHHGEGLGDVAGTRGAARIQKIIDDLTKTIADDGDLPGNLTKEEAQKIVDGLTTALAAKDTATIKDLLSQLRHEHQEDHVQDQIDRLKEVLASGKLPTGLTADDVQKAIDGLTTALAAGDLKAAAQILKDLHQKSHDQQQQDKLADHIQDQIDRLQSAIDNNKLPDGLTAENAQKLIDALKAAKESGDLSGVRDLVFTFRVQNLIDKINAAIANNTEIPMGLTKDAAQTLVTGLTAALANNDLAAAKKLLDDLHGSAGGGVGPGGHGHHGHGHHGHGHARPGTPDTDGDDDDTTGGDTTGGDTTGGDTTGDQTNNVPGQVTNPRAIDRVMAQHGRSGRRR